MLNIYAGIDEQATHVHMHKVSHLASDNSFDLASKIMRKSTLGLFLGRQEQVLRGRVPIPAEAS
jgi:hypothetical protein